MQFKIEDYPLPPEITRAVSRLAEDADALFIGEIHGTRQIPQIIASLLPMFKQQNYQGLGVEIPYVAQNTLDEWLSNNDSPIPLPGLFIVLVPAVMRLIFTGIFRQEVEKCPNRASHE